MRVGCSSQPLTSSPLPPPIYRILSSVLPGSSLDVPQTSLCTSSQHTGALPSDSTATHQTLKPDPWELGSVTLLMLSFYPPAP